MNKKLLSFFLALLLILSLSACDSSKQGGEDPSGGKGISVESEHIKAQLLDNELTLWLDSKACAFLNLKPDAPYKVQRLYNNYTDVFIGTIEGDNEELPHVFLLTDNGTVEVVDFAHQVLYDDAEPVIVSSGELWGLYDVTGFEQGVIKEGPSADDEWPAVFALTADGEKINIAPALFMTMYRLPEHMPPKPSEAMELLAENEEVQYYLDQGMSLLSAGNESIIYILSEDGYEGYVTEVFLGTNHEENFVREIYLAVTNSGDVYQYDVSADSWVFFSHIPHSSLDVQLKYAEDVADSKSDKYVNVNITNAEPSIAVLFTAKRPVKNFQVLTLHNGEWMESIGRGMMAYGSFAIKHEQAELAKDAGVLVRMDPIESISGTGIAFTDQTGKYRSFSVNISGKDGSLYLEEILVGAEISN